MKLKTESYVFIVQIKIWIQLRIPKIEDGNNFGVSIQVRMSGALEHGECLASSMCLVHRCTVYK